VPKSDIDELYLVRPYYLVPEGKVGHDAFAVIRETIRSMNKVAIARVVLTNREHIIALEARGKGLVGMLLRYPYEIRDEKDYFDDIQDVKLTNDMLDLARHIVESKSADFEPGNFEDRYENSLVELLQQKRKGAPIRTLGKQRDTGNVVNLMDALRKSLSSAGKSAPQSPKGTKSKKAAAGQGEMLMAISGKGAGKSKGAAKETKRPSRQRKAS